MTLLEQLAEFYAKLGPGDIPEAVLFKARLTLLDHLGVYVAGFQHGVLVPALLAYAKGVDRRSEVSVLLTGNRTDAETAALVSGAVAHSVELDDGHRYGTAHPAVVVIPPVLAMAEKMGSSLSSVLAAIAVGYDWMLRTARAINPSHLQRGFHTTSTTGTIGSAAATAHLLGFDSKKMANSVSIAALLSSGIQEMLHSNPAIKAFQVGRSAQAGILSADMVNLGALGPRSVYEGEHGWLKAMTDHFREADLTGELGSRWEIMDTYTKLYPTCRHCHHAIDLALEWFHEGVDCERIARISICTYSVAAREVGATQMPCSVDEAMFSIRYAVALALLMGSVDMQTIPRMLADSEVSKLMAKMDLVISEAQDCAYPEERGCEMELVFDDGRSIVKKTRLPKGEPDTPLTAQEVRAKFLQITKPLLDRHQGEEIWSGIIDVDDGSEIGHIFSLFPTVNK